MGIFGMRIGKVLAAFGLCMALFCAPAGADVKEDLSAIDKDIQSTREDSIHYLDQMRKGIINSERFLSLLFNTQERLYWLKYNLNYILYNNNDSNIESDIYKIRRKILSLEFDFAYNKNFIEIAQSKAFAYVYLEKSWMPYQVSAILDGLFFDSITFDNNYRLFYSIRHLDCENKGIGIVLWNKRAPALKAYAEKRGGDWQDLKIQLDFFQQELETIAPKEVARLRNSKTREEATKAFDDFMNYYNTIK
ncbi:phage tail tip lysozyme [Bartonella sp. DGB2]|uniref:phage tail tip lysozyme n=1 Tax=Bartonella sp. DGB2 TaxID=3388426 RepID=UPI00398F9E0B